MLPAFLCLSMPLTPASDINKVIDAATKSFMHNGHTIGASVGVVFRGKAYARHFGVTDLQKRTRATLGTSYAIGSITKTFTGALLAKAVTERKAALDDDIRKHLQVAYPGLEFEGEPIRLYQLIDHTSGLPRSLSIADEPPPPPEFDFATASPIEQLKLDKYTRTRFFRDLEGVRLTRRPGTAFGYSNAAAQLLGLILEDIYKVPFEQLVKQKILNRLAMKSTVVTGPDMSLAKAYSQGKPFFPALSKHLPCAGSMISTTGDMLKYLQYQMEESNPVVALTHRQPGNIVWDPNGNFFMGLNWQVMKSGTRRNIFQDGSVPGYHCMMSFSPDRQLGVVILTNEHTKGPSPALSPLVNEILKAIDAGVLLTP